MTTDPVERDPETETDPERAEVLKALTGGVAYVLLTLDTRPEKPLMQMECGGGVASDDDLEDLLIFALRNLIRSQ